VNARLKPCPAEKAAISPTFATATGVVRSVVLPSPRPPWMLSPHEYSDPSAAAASA
jgi:hypothetical protein